MRFLLRVFVPVAVLAASAAVVAWLMSTRPEAQLRKPPSSMQAVDVARLVRIDYQVVLNSQGTVRPRTESTLKPEVNGRIVSVSPSFRDGGFFEEGEVLLTIDPRDYETAVVVAQANVKLKESELELERAQHEQAKENWSLLGDGDDPSPLTLREPQLAEAMSDLESARARLVQAERDLERTQIQAPYAGRIQRKSVDVGQVVTLGNDLATLFAIDFVEIRLPLPNDQLDFIRLPEEYRGGGGTVDVDRPRVVLRGDYGSRSVTWTGEVVRAEGAYDAQTRQLFVIAQVDDPYARRSGDNPPLKVGQFVSAEIQGELLTNVFVIPRPAVRSGGEVLIVDEQNRIHRRWVEEVRRDKTHVVVREGLMEGEALCTTPLIFAADGAEVMPRRPGVGPARTVEGGQAQEADAGSPMTGKPDRGQGPGR